jgi:hypothetical protein
LFPKRQIHLDDLLTIIVAYGYDCCSYHDSCVELLFSEQHAPTNHFPRTRDSEHLACGIIMIAFKIWTCADIKKYMNMYCCKFISLDRKKRPKLDVIELQWTGSGMPISLREKNFLVAVGCHCTDATWKKEKDGQSRTPPKLYPCIADDHQLPSGTKTTTNTLRTCMSFGHAHITSRTNISIHRTFKMKDCRTMCRIANIGEARCPLEDRMRRKYDTLVTAVYIDIYYV